MKGAPSGGNSSVTAQINHGCRILTGLIIVSTLTLDLQKKSYDQLHRALVVTLLIGRQLSIMNCFT